MEGTDLRYGARHLKRAIERHLVQPLSNLMASDQICAGDSVRVDYDAQARRMVFVKDDENISPHMMSEVAREVLSFPAMAQAQGAAARTAWRRKAS